jgi:hypothetical protein
VAQREICALVFQAQSVQLRVMGGEVVILSDEMRALVSQAQSLLGSAAPVDGAVPGAEGVPALPEGGAGALPEDDLGGAVDGDGGAE